ncbi:MAG: hypothetical protein MR488_04885 [Lachnospiraceae bacterium]|nr:hypothetical protein [Lachnospiraceae bacterium]
MMTEEAIRKMDAMELIDSFRQVCRYGKPESFDDMTALANLIREIYTHLSEAERRKQ